MSIPTPDLSEQATRDFWKSTFLTVLAIPAEPYATARNSADQAVADLRARLVPSPDLTGLIQRAWADARDAEDAVALFDIVKDLVKKAGVYEG